MTIQQLVDSLTYDKTVSVSIIQYAILFGIITGAIAVDHEDKNIYACVAVAIVVQALLWGLRARGVSLIYCIVIGYITMRRSKEMIHHNKFPEWVVWVLVFVFANLISILTTYGMIGVSGVAVMTIAHCAGFALGVGIARIAKLIIEKAGH